MKQHKFRVWDGDEYLSLSQAMHQGLVGVQHNDADSFELESYYEHVILEQWTGVLDKNGKEIYGNDQVKYIGNLHGVERCSYKIIWQPKKAGFGMIQLKWPYNKKGMQPGKHFEVIGNIHDKEE